MLKEDGLKVVVVYVAVTNGSNLDSYAPRWVQGYKQYDSGYPHDVIVCCNGGPLHPRRQAYFDGVKCTFMPRENDAGFDISAFQAVADITDADFMVCMGESIHFHCDDWLKLLVDARVQLGPGMYGYFATHAVRAHLNTSAFGVDPHFLSKYPRVLNHGARYEFEHGSTAMWRRIAAGKGAAVFVTRDGVWMPGQWRMPKNILNSGTQRNLLLLANHTTRFDAANPNTRAAWESGANQAYQ